MAPTIVFVDDAHTFGGAQIALGRAIRAIIRRTDKRVICVCTSSTRAAVEEIVGNDIRLEFIDCPSALPLNCIFFPLRLPSFFLIILRLRLRGIRMWWLNLASIEFCLAPLFALKLLGAKPRAWLHHVQRFSFYQGNATWTRRVVCSFRDAITDHLLLARYPLIATPSRASSRLLGERGRDTCQSRIVHLYPTVSIGEQSVPSCTVNDSHANGMLDLWMIGRVEYATKNNLAAVETLSILRAQRERVRLSIVGDGPDLDDFKLKAERRNLSSCIDYLGWMKRPWARVPEHAIVFIPSISETINMVAIEAMLHGRRLVASPHPALVEGFPIEMIAGNFEPASFALKILEVAAMERSEVLIRYKAALEKFSEAAFVQRFQAYSELR